MPTLSHINRDLTITFPSKGNYSILKAQYNANNEYVKSLNKNWLSPEEQKAKPFPNLTNEDLSNIETADFVYNPPKAYTVYIDEKKRVATTWTGQVLGTIYLGDDYISNFGDKRRSVFVYGINGKNYFGTFYKGAGDYAHIKQSKTDNTNNLFI